MKSRTLRYALVGLGLAAAQAMAFPVLSGDPVNSATGRAHVILPGLPLLLPQPDGTYDPPIVVPGTIGDVDLVVRTGSPMIGPTIPPPAVVPPTATAGGVHVVAGSEVPFTVAVSDGSATGGTGLPLLGPEMDGLPVVVFAYADLDGDGFVGPTLADGDPIDEERERQESDFVVGRRAAIFEDGVATGTIAIWNGAPASAGGLTVVLTAASYVGPFSPGFMEGNVPDGPAIATLMPFFADFDPERVIDAQGQGGPASPTVRLGVELEDAFEPPVNDPELGTPFALPTDGSSPTIDRAVVHSGATSRPRFARTSVAAGFPTGDPIELRRGAGGEMLEPTSVVTLPDDGPGNGVNVRVVPADLLDNVADPTIPMAVTLTASGGVRIVSPDVDADTTTELVSLATAAGVSITVDDTAGAADSGSGGTLTALVGGVPLDVAQASFGGGGSSVTPAIVTAIIAGDPSAFVRTCPVARTLVVVVDDPQGDAERVDVAVSVGGMEVDTIRLDPGMAPFGVSVPPGQVFIGSVATGFAGNGTAVLSLVAEDEQGHVSAPYVFAKPIVTSSTPSVSSIMVTPTTIARGARVDLVVSAHVVDDCGLRRVVAEVDRGSGYRRLVRMRDDGKGADVVAGDGTFTGLRGTRFSLPGSFPSRVVGRNRIAIEGFSAGPSLQITGP